MVVKTHGMLMSGEMIRAYQAGLKWQTRRTRGLDEINKSPDAWILESGPAFEVAKQKYCVLFRNIKTDIQKMIYLPYGYRGDTLWFKETYKMWESSETGQDFIHYRADDLKVDPVWWTDDDWKEIGDKDFKNWKSSLFMKHKFSRFLDIPILNVRVERVKDITHEDAIAEGCPDVYRSTLDPVSPIPWYFSLWDKLNGDKLPVAVNPWVWVYVFPAMIDENCTHKIQGNGLCKCGAFRAGYSS